MVRQNPGLIQTKFQRPALGRDILPRPHLINRLNRSQERNLTLISAPAGYGKSITASAWVESVDWPVAWLSLDKNDNNLRTFLLYYVGAIQTIFPDACPETFALLNGAELPPPDYLASILVNETSYFPEKFSLVLDDYYHITDRQIQQVIATLIHYQFPRLHLVMVTRQDPMLDLFNLRAKGLLTELRLQDLRFNQSEAQQFCTNKLGKPVSDEMAAQLTERTEGWPAGLRLACLAMRPLEDYTQFLQNFQGTNRFIMGYLVEEVLARQPPYMQSFLLSTSLLDRFCPALAEAVLTAISAEKSTIPQPLPSAHDILEQINRANLFLISLDQEGQWYRYHHLFQELLQYRLQAEWSKPQIVALHNKAGDWFAQHKYIEEALDHYFLAENIDAAVHLISGQRYSLLNQTLWQDLEQYLHRFPPDIIERYPDLLIIKIWLLYHHSQHSILYQALQQLEELLPDASLPEEAVRHFQAEMSALYSLLAYLNVQPDEAINLARFAIVETPAELWIVRSLARTILAGALQMIGDMQGAYDVVYSSLAKEEEQSNHFKSTIIQIVSSLAWIDADMNRVIEAGRQNIELSQNNPSRQIQGMGRYHLGSALYQLNELDGAEEQFSMVCRQPYLNYGEFYFYSAIGLVLTYLARERFNDTEQVMEALLGYLVKTGNAYFMPVARAFQAEIALRKNDLSAACQWAAQFNEPPPPALAYKLYAPELTLAKIWMAQNTPTCRQLAQELLSNLQTLFTTVHYKNQLLQVMAVRALLYEQAGEEDKAQAVLLTALNQARPGNMIRAFVDLGPPMAQLLNRILPDATGLMTYIAEIISAFVTSPTPSFAKNGELYEELTNREVDILILLVGRKANKEIAQELFITEHTVRFHLKNIYSKLDVNNRRQAAIRARDLGIIVLP